MRCTYWLNVAIHKNSLIHNLWMLAREKLANASKIVFIGYSFPSTDFYVEWLFRQVYFLVDDKHKDFKHEIVVINPDMYKKDSETLRRYKTIFKDHKITTFKTLRSYVKFISHCEKKTNKHNGPNPTKVFGKL